MRLPIQYALTYPDAPALAPREPHRPPSGGASSSRRSRRAPTRRTTSSARPPRPAATAAPILNAADEVAVAAFLDGRIGVPADRDTIADAVDRWGAPDEPDLEAIAALDAEVRSELRSALGLAASGLMEVIGTVAAFLGVLVVLVLVHELGHFIVAKRAGITVEEFGIGFPPRITSVTWHGTRYSLNWIPLGGFVQMLGEDGDVEVRRLREQGLTDAEVEHAMAGAFNRRPIWVRIGVLLAGVVMNFVLAAGAVRRRRSACRRRSATAR